MGQKQSSQHLSIKQLNQRYIFQNDYKQGNCCLLRDRHSHTVYMMKQTTYTSEEQFEAAVRKLKMRQLLRHEHYMPLANFFVRVQSSFCSTFHKVNCLYEYGNHSLRNEVQARVDSNKPFQESQVWSILCSCCIVMAYLQKNSVEYRLVSAQNIFLTEEGVVRMIDPELAQVSHNNMHKPYYAPELLMMHRQSSNACVFSLAMVILELLFLQPLTECYNHEQFSFNESLFNVRIVEFQKRQGYSAHLKQTLLEMLKSDRQRPGILQLEQMLLKMVGSGIGESIVTEPTESVNAQELTPMVSQCEELSEFPSEKVQPDVENPDETENNQTQRNLSSSNSHKLIRKDPNVPDGLHTFSKDQLTTVIKKERPVEFKTTAGSQDENIFTDPRLLEMAKKDLEDISLRKSICKMPMNGGFGQHVRTTQSQGSSNVVMCSTVLGTQNANGYLTTPLFEPINQSNLSSQTEYVNETYNKGQYEGQKKNGLRNGYGTFYYKQGGKYTGEWKDNRMHGKGTLFYYNQLVAYEGQWREDRLWGKGTLYNQQPKKLHGSFDYKSWDQLDDYWVKYQGDFVDDNRCGKGIYFLTNGQRFQGSFDNDALNGEGTFYAMNGKTIRGIWKDNMLIRQY